jgi:cysteine desulfurase/selenocysteine lyase
MTVAAKPSFDVQAVRDDFPILATEVHGGIPLVYLDNAATTQRPRQVIDAIRTAYEEKYANVHRGIHFLSEVSTELFENARDRVQRFINARRRDEIIFTSGTTASVNLVARSWGDANLRAGDEILLTQMEHHSNIVPWQQVKERTGCTVRFLPITDDGLLALDSLDQMLTDRTKLVSVTMVSNVLGTRNPVQAIVKRAHEAGAVVFVDAAQSAPHETVNVQQLGADFLAFSAHKMLGPSGVGVLYGRAALLERMPPFLGGGSMIHRVTEDGFTPADLPSKFEAGTPPIVSVIGLAAAIDYLDSIGLDNIHRHERALTTRAHQILEPLDGVRILGPHPEDKGGIVSLVVDGVQANDLAMAMDEQGVAVRAGHHCAMPLHARLGVPASARASFYLYNTLDEVERLGEALRKALSILRRK